MSTNILITVIYINKIFPKMVPHQAMHGDAARREFVKSHFFLYYKKLITISLILIYLSGPGPSFDT